MNEDYVWIFSIIAGYVVIVNLVIRLERKLTRNFNPIFKRLSESLSYALLFGIGILSRGGEPGFAIPMPILPASFFGVWDWIPTKNFVNGIIIPFFFWWGLFFLIVWVRSKSSREKKHSNV